MEIDGKNLQFTLLANIARRMFNEPSLSGFPIPSEEHLRNFVEVLNNVKMRNSDWHFIRDDLHSPERVVPSWLLRSPKRGNNS